MNTDKAQQASANRAARRGALRMRLSLLVVATVTLGIGVATIIDYRREARAQTEDLFDGLEDEVMGLKLARARIRDPREFEAYTDQYCMQMNEHVSPGHHILVIDSRGSLIVNAQHHSGAEVTQALTSTDERESILPVGNRRLAQFRVRDTDGSTIVVAQYMDLVEDTLRAEVLSRLITVAIVGVLLMLLIFFVVNNLVLKPVARLAVAAKAWSARGFSTRSEVAGSAELRMLAGEFNAMAADLERVEQEREADMVKARHIQSNLLPSAVPSIPGLSVAALYRPAEFVASDLYDVFILPGGKTVLLVLDVSGHGVSAALLTGVVKMSLHRRLAEEDDPAKAIMLVNRDLLACATEGEFVTVCVGVWNHVERTWTYCAAGHEGGMLISGGRLTALPATGALLGVLEKATWTNRVVKLRNGDRLILFTDGVVDARAPSRPFGSAGLERVIQTSLDVSLPDQITRIADEAEKHCVPRACDDMTIVGLEVLPGDHGGQYYAI